MLLEGLSSGWGRTGRRQLEFWFWEEVEILGLLQIRPHPPTCLEAAKLSTPLTHTWSLFLPWVELSMSRR